MEKSGEDSDEAVDGIIGFGQANTSALSQLSAVKKVKKVFSHCLDGKEGGGIFAIGEVVKPQYSSTPMIPDMYVIYHFIILWWKVDFLTFTRLRENIRELWFSLSTCSCADITSFHIL